MQKESFQNKNPSIKILVGYHKPAVLLKDEILTPIHLGRALATEASKDGELSQEDYEWLCENMIGDDTGDNISHLNRYFCELTGIYWAWKNYDKLGNPDYIGFMHYRRQFLFDEIYANSLYFHPENGWPLVARYNSSLPKIHTQDIFNKLKDVDLIIPNYFDLLTPYNPYLSYYKTIEDWYPGTKRFVQNLRLSIGHELYKFIINNVERFYPYKKSLKTFLKSCGYYPCNMFIMEKSLYFEFCEFMFDMLFTMFKIMKQDLEARNAHEARELGYCAEFLSMIFYLKKLDEKELKHKELLVFWEDLPLTIRNGDVFNKQIIIGTKQRVKNHLS